MNSSSKFFAEIFRIMFTVRKFQLKNWKVHFHVCGPTSRIDASPSADDTLGMRRKHRRIEADRPHVVVEVDAGGEFQ